MVAPASRTRRSAPSPALRRARQVVAKTLLHAQTPTSPRAEDAPPAAPWKAWLLAAWIAAVAVAGVVIVVQYM